MSEHNEEARGTGMNMSVYTRPGGAVYGKLFCGAPHPHNAELGPDEFDAHFCRRYPHFDGSDHAAFTFKISEAETWPDTRELP